MEITYGDMSIMKIAEQSFKLIYRYSRTGHGLLRTLSSEHIPIKKVFAHVCPCQAWQDLTTPASSFFPYKKKFWEASIITKENFESFPDAL